MSLIDGRSAEVSERLVEDSKAVRIPSLSASNIRKRYGTKAVLEDVSLALHAGGVVALVGENGCGSSGAYRHSTPSQYA